MQPKILYCKDCQTACQRHLITEQQNMQKKKKKKRKCIPPKDDVEHSSKNTYEYSSSTKMSKKYLRRQGYKGI